jgi:hypothetical protein
MGGISSSGAEDAIRSMELTTITQVVANLQNNNYVIEAFLPSTNLYKLVGIRVDNGYLTTLPLVNKYGKLK